MKQFVAIVNPATILEAHKADLVAVLDTPGITGVDVRWSLRGERGAVERNIAALNVLRLARDRGLEIRLHAWVGSPTGLSDTLAQDQARQVAKVCTSEGVNVFGVNAENDVWAHAGAVPFLHTWLDTFYETGRRTFVQYLGYTYPPLFYGKSVTIPEELKRRFHTCAPMIYQNTPEAVRGKIAVAEREWPEHALNAYISCGRIDSKGIVQGAWSTWLAEAQRFEEITWYVGNGRAWEQLTQGNSQHPPLTIAIPRLAGLT